MFEFDRQKAKAQLFQNRATGEPSSGFRVCAIIPQGGDTVVSPVDEEALNRMVKAVGEAVDQLRTTDDGA